MEDGQANFSSSCLGAIGKGEGKLHPFYSHPELTWEYNTSKIPSHFFLSPQYQSVLPLVRKFQRISTRNRLTHRIILGIIRRQGPFLRCGNPIKLRPLTQRALTKSWELTDTSRISRVIQGLTILTPCGNEVTIKSFLPSHREINKMLLMEFLDKERRQLEEGKIVHAHTDPEIAQIFKEQYKIALSPRILCNYRKDLALAVASVRRHGYCYPPLSRRFSSLFPLTVDDVRTRVSNSAGLYEFRLAGKDILYLKGNTGIFYIGSSQNLTKRLMEHLRPNIKNNRIRSFLTSGRCFFRVMKCESNWKQEEKLLYDLFIQAYGTPPKCNRARPWD